MPERRSPVKSFAAHVLAVLLLAPIGTITTVARGASAAPVVTTPPAAFVPVQPCRLADTRPDGGNGYSRVDPQTISISTLNRCGIPTGSTALAVTLTVVDPAAEGFLTAWPGLATTDCPPYRTSTFKPTRRAPTEPSPRSTISADCACTRRCPHS